MDGRQDGGQNGNTEDVTADGYFQTGNRPLRMYPLVTPGSDPTQPHQHTRKREKQNTDCGDVPVPHNARSQVS
jgi:hypothetical protein